MSIEHGSDRREIFQEIADLQLYLGINNPQLNSLAYELGETLKELAAPDTLHPRAKRYIAAAQIKYGPDFLNAFEAYIDMLIDAARPMIEGSLTGFTAYACESHVNQDDGEITYTGRSDALVYDAWAFASRCAIADSTHKDSAPLPLSQLPQIRTSPRVKPATPPPDCAHLKTFITEAEVQGRLEVRKEIMTILAALQHMLAVQETHQGELRPSVAFGIPQEPAHEQLATHLDTILIPKRLKHFVRTGILNRGLRKEILAALPIEQKNGALPSLEEAADRIILRGLWNELKELIAHPIHENSITELPFIEDFTRLFANYMDVLMDTLGRSIGRSIGRSLHPINKKMTGAPSPIAPPHSESDEGNDSKDDEFDMSKPLSPINHIETVIDARHEAASPPLSFDEKLLPFVDITHKFLAVVVQLQELTRLLKKRT